MPVVITCKHGNRIIYENQCPICWREKTIRNTYRKDCSRNLFMLMSIPFALHPKHVWDIIAEYFTHK